MSFNSYEVSNEGGHPIALYAFRYGNTVWRYCTADEDQTVGFEDDGVTPAVYVAEAIGDDGVTQGGSDQNDIRITIAANSPVVALFRNTQPTNKVWLTVRRWHLGDPDDETPLLWTGTATNAQEQDDATYTLVGRSLGGSYDRDGLRLAWSRMCPHVLYDIGCNNNGSNPKEAHAYPREIALVSGNGFSCVTHAEPEEGSFSGGFLEYARPDGSMDRKAIEWQDGNDFRVLGSTSGLTPGLAVTLYPGCARNTENCKAFDNLPNYGGFPHLPGQSPFGGTAVF